jgi:hypothetical protein
MISPIVEQTEIVLYELHCFASVSIFKHLWKLLILSRDFHRFERFFPITWWTFPEGLDFWISPSFLYGINYLLTRPSIDFVLRVGIEPLGPRILAIVAAWASFRECNSNISSIFQKIYFINQVPLRRQFRSESSASFFCVVVENRNLHFLFPVVRSSVTPRTWVGFFGSIRDANAPSIDSSNLALAEDLTNLIASAIDNFHSTFDSYSQRILNGNID